MSADGRGEVAVALLRAAAMSEDFPADVEDSTANRALFARIKSEIAALPAGVIPDVPWDSAGTSGGND